MGSFAVKPRGHGPTPHLTFTCVHGNKSIFDILGQRLVKEAEALGVGFQYTPLNVNSRDLTLEMLQVRPGEAVAFCLNFKSSCVIGRG